MALEKKLIKLTLVQEPPIEGVEVVTWPRPVKVQYQWTIAGYEAQFGLPLAQPDGRIVMVPPSGEVSFAVEAGTTAAEMYQMAYDIVLEKETNEATGVSVTAVPVTGVVVGGAKVGPRHALAEAAH